MGAADCQLPTCPVVIDGQVVQFVVIELWGVPVRVLSASVDGAQTVLVPFTDVPLLIAARLRDAYREGALSLDAAILAQLGGLQS